MGTWQSVSPFGTQGSVITTAVSQLGVRLLMTMPSVRRDDLTIPVKNRASFFLPNRSSFPLRAPFSGPVELRPAERNRFFILPANYPANLAEQLRDPDGRMHLVLYVQVLEDRNFNRKRPRVECHAKRLAS